MTFHTFECNYPLSGSGFATLHRELKKLGSSYFESKPKMADKIKNKYRWRILIKCKFGEDIIDLMNDTLQKAQTIKYCKNGDANISIDVNPTNMV